MNTHYVEYEQKNMTCVISINYPSSIWKTLLKVDGVIVLNSRVIIYENEGSRNDKRTVASLPLENTIVIYKK